MCQALYFWGIAKINTGLAAATKGAESVLLKGIIWIPTSATEGLRKARLPGGGHDHAFPEIREAASAFEGRMFEAGLSEQSAEGVAAEEFDVASVEERVGVVVPFVGEGEGEVFPVAVVRGGAEEGCANAAGGVATANETARVIKVLDDFKAIDHVEGLLVECVEEAVVGADELEAAVGVGVTCDVDAGGCEVDADDSVAAAEEFSGDGAVAAPDIEEARTLGQAGDVAQEDGQQIVVTTAQGLMGVFAGLEKSAVGVGHGCLTRDLPALPGKLWHIKALIR